MDKQKKQKIMTAILVPVSILLVWSNIISPRLKQKKTMPSVIVEVSSSEAPDDKKSAEGNEVRLERIKRYTAETWDRNPFKVVTKETESTMALDGIMWDDQSPLAMINGDVYMLGQSVGAYEIIKITKTQVELKKNEKIITIDLLP